MAKSPRNARKLAALRQHGSLNPHPESVMHELFQGHDFFDPNDLVQVKYEMLRQVQMEESTVTETAAQFGLSRPSFYEAQAAFRERGVLGLVPEKRGPKRAHKLTAEVMTFLDALREGDPSLTVGALAERLWQERGVRVHRRSVERALGRQEKKLRSPMLDQS